MESFNSLNSKSFLESIKDPRKFKQFLKNNQKELLQWGAFVFITIFVFLFFSSGDFSFILTLSSLVQTFGFVLLVWKVYRSRSISGLSRNTLVCYFVCILSRLFSIMRYEGYLPYDATGDFVYRITEIITFVCCCILLYFSFFLYKATYNWDIDTFQWYYFVIPSFLLALCIHPSLNLRFYADVAWTFGLYLESFAMFPQLDVFRKKGGEIESYTSHYVASQTLSRIMQFIFWVFSFKELNETVNSSSFFPSYVGFFVLIAQIIQIALTGDFLYFYITSIKQGIPLTLPSYVI
ncbi:hypothetical protein ABPG74_017621 [Tetrahymena malaccensis]